MPCHVALTHLFVVVVVVTQFDPGSTESCNATTPGPDSGFYLKQFSWITAALIGLMILGLCLIILMRKRKLIIYVGRQPPILYRHRNAKWYSNPEREPHINTENESPKVESAVAFDDIFKGPDCGVGISRDVLVHRESQASTVLENIPVRKQAVSHLQSEPQDGQDAQEKGFLSDMVALDFFKLADADTDDSSDISYTSV